MNGRSDAPHISICTRERRRDDDRAAHFRRRNRPAVARVDPRAGSATTRWRCGAMVRDRRLGLALIHRCCFPRPRRHRNRRTSPTIPRHHGCLAGVSMGCRRGRTDLAIPRRTRQSLSNLAARTHHRHLPPRCLPRTELRQSVGMSTRRTNQTAVQRTYPPYRCRHSVRHPRGGSAFQSKALASEGPARFRQSPTETGSRPKGPSRQLVNAPPSGASVDRQTHNWQPLGAGCNRRLHHSCTHPWPTASVLFSCCAAAGGNSVGLDTRHPTWVAGPFGRSARTPRRSPA